MTGSRTRLAVLEPNHRVPRGEMVEGEVRKGPKSDGARLAGHGGLS
jgi:hypothetical protein